MVVEYGGASVADEAKKLLDYIVRRYVVHDELVAIDLDASASDLGQSIETEKQSAARREMQRADDLADDFAEGLARASDLRGAGQNELALDDRNPTENRIADAMIGFLVSYHLASSHTEETDAGHYVYYIAVDWDRIKHIADEAGLDLAQAVRRG